MLGGNQCPVTKTSNTGLSLMVTILATTSSAGKEAVFPNMDVTFN